MEGDDARRLVPRVEEVIASQALLRPGETVLAAVSGGADSVALLLLLYALKDRLSIRLHAAHYEHGIRGAASLADAAFVQGLCAEREIPCAMGAGDVPSMRAEWKCSLEDAARRARYAFLAREADAVGATKIALAHQLEDQAETLLLHLVHGSGLQGLSGMRAMQGRYIRPLLDIERAALEAYLHEKGISWREDETNYDTQYARNLLRLKVFPLLRMLNPQADRAMARAADIVREASDSLERQAAKALAGRTKGMPYGAFWAAEDTADPVAVRRFARQAGVPELDARQTYALAGINPGEQINLPGGWRALRTKERLHLLSPKPGGAQFLQSMLSAAPASPGSLGDGIRTQALDAEAMRGAVLRPRQSGDVFAPLGMDGTQKLKDVFIGAGVDRPFRDFLPVLAKGSRVLWIIGLKPSRDAAIGPQTENAVMLTYHGPLPWELQEEEELTDGGIKDDQCANFPNVP